MLQLLQILRSTEAARGATVGLIVVVAGLVGQMAARGMTLSQWGFGLMAILGAITLAVIVRCWPQQADRAAAE